MLVPGKSWAWILLLAVPIGCSRTPARPVGPGAKNAVRHYYDGLVRQDWRQAYDALHPDSKQRRTRQEFTRLAEAYRRNLGFNPEEMHVRSCEEKETEAIAHVVLTGHLGSKRGRYKDGVILRRSADGWGVLLPDNFGSRTR